MSTVVTLFLVIVGIIVVAVLTSRHFRDARVALAVLLGAFTLFYAFVEPGSAWTLVGAVAFSCLFAGIVNRHFGGEYGTWREALGNGMRHLRGLGAYAPTFGTVSGFWRKPRFWVGALASLVVYVGVQLVGSVVLGALWAVLSTGVAFGVLRLHRLDQGSQALFGSTELVRLFDRDGALGLSEALKNTETTTDFAGRFVTIEPNPLLAVGIEREEAAQLFDAVGIDLVEHRVQKLLFAVRFPSEEDEPYGDDEPSPVAYPSSVSDDEVTL
ncbi:hypothetical protein [Frigoribacterium sp. 9N]|uniref:hypothetical protein n=1 Tax=Frigoribacterium sp. 9N TaxID=2653144 RepID=UPI0012F263CB|nr:hypothetical protein [Frigoribacterium sp. 9N]VXB73442.1 membrane hypothetical protein [Frigoribacterium sp. 9N]